MIMLIPTNGMLSVLSDETVEQKGFEPILYSLDELQDTSFRVALESHSQTTIELYSNKMTSLYFGYRKKNEKGKYIVYPRNIAERLVKGSQKRPPVAMPH